MEAGQQVYLNNTGSTGSNYSDAPFGDRLPKPDAGDRHVSI